MARGLVRVEGGEEEEVKVYLWRGDDAYLGSCWPGRFWLLATRGGQMMLWLTATPAFLPNVHCHFFRNLIQTVRLTLGGGGADYMSVDGLFPHGFAVVYRRGRMFFDRPLLKCVFYSPTVLYCFLRQSVHVWEYRASSWLLVFLPSPPSPPPPSVTSLPELTERSRSQKAKFFPPPPPQCPLSHPIIPPWKWLSLVETTVLIIKCLGDVTSSCQWDCR